MDDTSPLYQRDTGSHERHDANAGGIGSSSSSTSARRFLGASYGSIPETSTARGDKPPLLKDYSDKELQDLEIKLKWKIDTRLLPMIILIYIMNYLDRNSIPGMHSNISWILFKT